MEPQRRAGDAGVAGKMTERRIAVVKSYDELIETLWRRVEELGLTREALDDVAGFQTGYSGKLLGLAHVRMLGRMSFGTILQALGLMLIVVEDPEALAKLNARGQKRKRPAVDASTRSISPIERVKMGLFDDLMKRARDGRQVKLSGRRRSRIARHAARSRWARKRMRRGHSPAKTALPQVV